MHAKREVLPFPPRSSHAMSDPTQSDTLVSVFAPAFDRQIDKWQPSPSCARYKMGRHDMTLYDIILDVHDKMQYGMVVRM